MKKLTVMVSVYNAGEFLENRLNNLHKSTVAGDMEIWVVNANSPDVRDHDIPQKFNVKYIKLPERVGVYAAWNHVISNSNSEYITNANADDIVAPNCYEKLIKILDAGHGLAYPSWYTTNHPNLTWDTIEQKPRTFRSWRKKHEIRAIKTLVEASGRPGNYNGSLENSGVGHFPMWRRSLHDSLGLFDEEFKALGDADWWARCHHLGKASFCWLDEFVACYLWRNGQNLWNQAINEIEWNRYHQKVEKYQSK